MKPYEELPSRNKLSQTPPILEEPSVEVLKEQKRSGQLNKPLEMLSVAHLLSGGRATPSGTHVKNQQNQVDGQDIQNDAKPAKLVDFNIVCDI